MARLYDPLTYTHPRTLDEAFPDPIKRAHWGYKEARGFPEADRPMLMVAVFLAIATVAMAFFK